MSYYAKPISLIEPLNIIKEIRDSINDFYGSWLQIHSTDSPLILYHYTTLEGLKGILDNRSIWCSHISTLNDPLELQYGKKIILEKLKTFLINQNESILKGIIDDIIMFINAFDESLYNTYISCFCEDNNLLSQWRAYSNKCIGYNLGISFDSNTKFSHSEDLSDESFMILRKVIYDKDLQNKTVNNCISLIIRGITSAIQQWNINKESLPIAWQSQAAIEATNPLYDIIFTLKNGAFKEEKEWRLIKVLQDNYKTKLINFREINSELFPFIKTYIYNDNNGNYEFPLKEIMCGPMLEEKKTRSAVRLFINSKVYNISFN